MEQVPRAWGWRTACGLEHIATHSGSRSRLIMAARILRSKHRWGVPGLVSRVSVWVVCSRCSIDMSRRLCRLVSRDFLARRRSGIMSRLRCSDLVSSRRTDEALLGSDSCPLSRQENRRARMKCSREDHLRSKQVRWAFPRRVACLERKRNSN